MKERILQLAKGEVDIETADIVCYPTQVDLTVSPEYSLKADVYLQSRNQVPIRAFVYSTDHRVVPSQNQAVGTKCSIHYEVLSMGLKAGSVIDGAFQFVALGREFEIPYHFVVEEGTVEEGIVPMFDTLDLFADYAATDAAKALKIFRSRSFLRMPFMLEDRRKTAMYEELVLHGKADARAMEEFLIYFGAKEAVNVRVDSVEPKTFVFRAPKKDPERDDTEVAEEVDLEAEAEAAEEENITGVICLSVNTGGYADITLESSAPYVVLSETHLTMDDFVDGKCEVAYTVQPQILLPGESVAVITVDTGDSVEEFEIICRNYRPIVLKKSADLLRKKKLSQAIDLYLDWKMSDKKDTETLNSLFELVESSRDYGKGDPMETLRLSLAYGYMCYLTGRIDDFRLVMDATYDDVSDQRKTDVGLYCFYLYLRYLMRPGTEQKATVARLLKKYYVEQEKLLTILIMLIEVDDQLADNDMLAYEMLREQYMDGERSPFLYAAAIRILNNHPEKIKKLEGFELYSLIFGTKHNSGEDSCCVGEKLAEAVARLSLYEKDFRPAVYHLLCFLYEKYPTKEILTGILCCLISGHQSDSCYFKWFAKGIEEDVHLTGIYEYYLDSMPQFKDEPMPQEILYFCADKTDLSLNQKEMLYHNVMTFYSQDSGVFEEYRDQIESFCIDQILQGRYNQILLDLYSHFLFKEMIDERIAQVLPVMLHVKLFTLMTDRIRWIIVRYPELVTEYRVRVKDRRACVPVYSKDAVILMEDENSNRYANISYGTKSLMKSKAFLDQCRKQGTKDLILNVMDTRELLNAELKRPEEVYRLLVLLDMAEVHPDFKKKIVSKLLAYCESTDGLDAMDSFLLGVDIRDLSAEDRIRLIGLLAKRGFVEDTYQILKQYGYTGVSPEVLASVVKYAILQVSYAYDAFLLNLCLELYRQKHINSVVISYLLRYFNGITDEMMELLDAGKMATEGGSFQIQMADFPERLLSQMMFVGRKERLAEVFDLYLGTQEHQQLFMPLIQSYFVIRCHDYFINGEKPDEDILTYIEQRLMENSANDMADILKIAILYNYSERTILEKNRLLLAKSLLNELYSKGYLFGFFSKLSQHIQLPETLNGKVIIEHRSASADRVRMEYRVVAGGANAAEYAASMLTENRMENDGTEENQDPVSGQVLPANMNEVFPKKQVLMSCAYPGVFAEAITLFDGERLLYTLREEKDRSSFEEEKTEPVAGKEQVRGPLRRYVIPKSRFDRINMAAGSSPMDVELEALLKEISYADAMAYSLFPLK